MFGRDFIKDTDVASVTNVKTLSEQDKGHESNMSGLSFFETYLFSDYFASEGVLIMMNVLLVILADKL